MSDFYLHKYGRNADVDGAEDIWDFGSYYLFPTQATTTQIVGLANDIPSSDGVHSVKIEGLLANGQEVTEVATLNGTTPVILTNSFYRINRMYIDAVGASGVNSGNILVSHSGSATLSMISPLKGQTMQAIYTMPVDASGHFKNWYVDGGQTGLFNNVKATAELQTREVGKGWRTKAAVEFTHSNPVQRVFQSIGGTTAVKPLTDIRVRITSINTQNVIVNAGFEIAGFRDIR
jgi:hypothetical protein